MLTSSDKLTQQIGILSFSVEVYTGKSELKHCQTMIARRSHGSTDSTPMYFGNMYNAAVWAQIVYILENYARTNDTIYFGSYGSGATCI